MINSMLSWDEHEQSLITSAPSSNGYQTDFKSNSMRDLHVVNSLGESDQTLCISCILKCWVSMLSKYRTHCRPTPRGRAPEHSRKVRYNNVRGPKWPLGLRMENQYFTTSHTEAPHNTLLLVLLRWKDDYHNYIVNIVSRDVASRSDITPCNKSDIPPVVYRFRTLHNDVH